MRLSGGQLGEGSRIGGYVLGSCIGQGGMARVFRAEHEALQRQVALKVLLDAPGGDGHERFLREARIAAAIKHPNVVNIYDVGVDRGRPYLVMELLEGVDLESFMAGRPHIDEAMAMDIIVPIAGALAAVHDAGIVHRDLKPGNIFLARGPGDELEPKLLDFGISKSATERLKLTSAGGPVLGTPFYMSPEAAAGGETTPLSDQYALGVVLYECVTGVNPFAGAGSFPEVVHRVTNGSHAPASTVNPQISRRLGAIIERAMQLDPAQRFPDMRAMGRELLLLARQRTRITWGLSFNSLPRADVLARAASALDPVAAAGAVVRAGSRRRGAALLVASAAAAGALGVVLTTGVVPPSRLAGVLSYFQPSAQAAPADRPELTLALQPQAAPTPVDEGSGPDVQLGQPANFLAEAATAAPEEPLERPAVADEPATRGRPAPVPRRAPRPAARSQPKAKSPLTLGTNNAPILD